MHLKYISKIQGGLDDYITIQVSIEPVNDLPEISGTFLNTLSHLEGTLEVIDFNASDLNDYDSNYFDIHYTEDQYLVWSIEGSSKDSFTISQQGTLVLFSRFMMVLIPTTIVMI